MIEVALVEDDYDIREGLTLLLNGTAGISCIGAFTSCEEALPIVPELLPDVLLLDISLPGISGIESIPLFRELLPELPIMMLTVHESDDKIFDSLSAGATGYIVKTTPPGKLISALEDLAAGGAPLSGHIARRVIGSFHRRSTELLTAREAEILSLLCEGLSYKMIAARLKISRGTVHCHIKRLYRKLEVNSSTQAVRKAFEEDLV